MSKIIKRPGLPAVLLVEPEPPGRCELCGKLDELRPYGPGGERICFGCASKDPEGTNRRLAQMMGWEQNDN